MHFTSVCSNFSDSIHSFIHIILIHQDSGADLGGGCRGCAPLPEMTYGFLIQLVFRNKNVVYCVLVTPFLSGAPLLKEILDPPLELK